MDTEYQTQTLEHLGLVAAMVDELGIVQTIDGAIEQSMDDRHLSIGMVVKAMILNGLGFANRQLYLMPQFFENKPLDRLLGEGIEPSHLNDKVCGRALDSLFESGVTALFSLVAKEAMRRLGLVADTLHLDSTAFSTYKRQEKEEREEEEPKVVRITKGHSKDHRPDLNQVMLNLIVENRHGIPLAMRALDGNSSDKKGFEEMIREHISLIQEVPSGSVVADSALYTKKNLQSMQEFSIRWITRVPERIKEASSLIEQTSFDAMSPHPTDERYRLLETQSRYGDIEQKWIVVFSKEARKRAQATLRRHYEKLSDQESKELLALTRHSFTCEADALAQIERLKKKLKLTQIVSAQVIPVMGYEKPGRPKKGDRALPIAYKLSLQIASSFQKYQKDLWRKSCFILASNDLNKPILDIFEAYKNQYIVERGFRFLKSPEFLADSLFLKKPQRIEALLFVMTLCLLVYSALEAKIRRSLAQTPIDYPDQKGKATKRPTARWVFQTFIDVHLLRLEKSKEIVTNLKSYNQRLLDILGPPFKTIYSRRGRW